MMTKPVWLAVGVAAAAVLSMACTTEVICEGEACNTGSAGSTTTTSSGGNNTGGNSGGNNTGGNNTGGNNTGGVNTGGTNTGGVNTGGGPGPGGSGPGGGGPGIFNFCDLMCSCQPCAPGELEQCYDDVGQFINDANNQGCGALLGPLDFCLGNASGCVPGPEEVFGCQFELDQLFACMNGTPPPSSLCDMAAQLCGAPPEPIECVGQVQCISACIVGAGHCDVNDPNLLNCVSNC